MCRQSGGLSAKTNMGHRIYVSNFPGRLSCPTSYPGEQFRENLDVRSGRAIAAAVPSTSREQQFWDRLARWNRRVNDA
jgi:hypothetical protein